MAELDTGADFGERTRMVGLTICPRPVFVVGAPRSGTTILARAMGAHPEFWAFNETQILWDLFGNEQAHKNFRRRGPGGSWLEQQGIGSTEFLGSLGIGLNALLTRHSHGRRWIDQTPVHALLANDLAELFPGARFLHMLRDGRRVVHSMINYRYKLESWATDFRSACWTWGRYVEAALTFAEGRPDRCLTVINEQLVANPTEGFRRIQQFLEAREDEAPAEFFCTHRVNSSFPSGATAVDRDQLLSDPTPGWSEEQRTAFWEEAGLTMVRCGFAAHGDLESEVGSVMNGRRGRLRHAAMRVAPPEATMLVMNQGDPGLLDLPGRRSWPFPGGPDRAVDLSDLSDGKEAVQHLEFLRARGGRYLLVPDRAFEWLEQSGQFKEHLERFYRAVWNDEVCRVHRLFNA